MRAQAQGRSSAANSDDSASRGAVSGSRDGATRASSFRSNGSSAPSHRRSRLALGTLAAFFALLAFASAAFAAKEVVNYFGTASGSGSLGGEFNQPRDIAVNRTGTGVPQGTIYVADDANNRIQRFDRFGRFVSAWGADVVQDGGSGDRGDATTGNFEVCVIASECKAGVAGEGNGTMDTNGVLDNPQSVAIDGDTGNVYVSDRDNRRVNVYDASGNFIRSFGWGVVLPGDPGDAAGTDEVQSVTIHATATGGRFALLFNGQTTGAAGSGQVSSGSNALGSVNTSSGAFAVGQVITGGGIPAGTTITAVDTNARTLTLSAAATTNGTTNITGHDIPWDASPAQVQAALEGVRGIGAGNVSVTSANPGGGVVGGPYEVTFQGFLGDRNVSQLTSSAAGLIATTRSVTISTTTPGATGGYEICEGASAACRAGEGGPGIGQVGTGTTAGTFGITVSQPDSNAATGTVFLADSGNRRVNTYDLDGANPASFGSAAEFGSSQPRKIAVDSRGIVYATDSNNGAEVDRYDTEDANGGGVGFLAPIAAGLPGVNETQRVTFSGFSASDTYTLTCPDASTTDPIVFTGAAASTRDNMDAALEAKCGPSFSQSSGPLNVVVTFQGNFAETNVPTMVCTTLTGAGSCSITQEIDGSPPANNALLTGGSTATEGLAVDPDSDGGGPDTDVLHVLRDPSSGNTVVQQFGPINRPGETAAPTAVDDTHASGAGFTTVNGLGLDDTSGRLLVSATNNVSGTASAHRVYLVQDVPAPVPVLDAITRKTTTTATFSGTVDPRGSLVRCIFQYSTDQVIWTDIPETDCPNLTPGGGPQAVREDVYNLRPATHYFVRLQVARIFVPGSEVTTALRVFDTDTAVPELSKIGAIQIQDTSARLVGTIDPNGSQTGYVFEYGTTPAMGSATTPVDIGAGNAPLVVTQLVTGLRADTRYFFRLVATNADGTTTSRQSTLRTRAEPLPLPDDRAYEQVSPPDKNGGDVLASGETTGGFDPAFHPAPDGNGVAYSSQNSFASGQHTSLAGGIYFTRRTESGWADSRALIPPFCTQGNSGLGMLLMPASVNFAEDFNHAVFNHPEGLPECSIAPLSPNAPDSVVGTNLYRSDLGDPAGYDLLHPDYGCLRGGFECPHYLTVPNTSYRGASEDQSLIVLDSHRPQTPDSLPNVPDDDGGKYRRIYQWTQLGTHGCANADPAYSVALDACLALVSIDPAGNPLSVDSIVPGTTTSGSEDWGTGSQEAINAVSDDGSRIYFQTGGSNFAACPLNVNASCGLYMREDAVTTHHVSQSECTVSCGGPGLPGAFELASTTGEAVVFLSARKLTDNDSNTTGADLYVYHHTPNPSTDPNLTFMSPDEETGDGKSANVLGVPGGSDDLNTVFFVAEGQLVAGESIAAGPKLYRWTWNSGTPTVEYLATLDAADQEENWESPMVGQAAVADGQRRERRVTPDGDTLIIETAAQVLPAVDHDSDVDVYRWTETEGWQCVSCQSPGEPSGGSSDTGRVGPNLLTVSNGTETAMTDDGKRIYFETQDSLIPEDTNGPCAFDAIVNFYPCTDIYEWNDGALSLITPGDSADPDETDVQLVGVTPSGSDVFFGTRQPLVGWDLDKNIDIYTARVGGGFPEPDAQGDVCEGEACRGAGSSPGAIPGAGSRALVAPVSGPKPNPCAPISKKLKRKQSALKKARRKGQAKRARALGKQSRNLRRRAKRCNRRQAR